MDIVAVSGHRPEKIQNETYLRAQIEKFLEQRRVERLIHGAAAGVDLWTAFIAIKLGVEVTTARPWAGHTPRAQDRKLYDFVIERSTEVVNVCEDQNYNNRPWLYQKRNEWMVDHADKVFAVWDGSSGGTKNCFDYALGKKPILRYFPAHGWSVYDASGKEIAKQWV